MLLWSVKVEKWVGLLQSQQLAEQDGFVTTWAMASQTEGTAKEATVLATALTDPTGPHVEHS